MYRSPSIPGTVVVDGETETATESGLRMALCPERGNVQFLEKWLLR